MSANMHQANTVLGCLKPLQHRGKILQHCIRNISWPVLQCAAVSRSFSEQLLYMHASNCSSSTDASISELNNFRNFRRSSLIHKPEYLMRSQRQILVLALLKRYSTCTRRAWPNRAGHMASSAPCRAVQHPFARAVNASNSIALESRVVVTCLFIQFMRSGAVPVRTFHPCTEQWIATNNCVLLC